MTQNPYQVLGVPNGADLAECTQAYKRLAKKYHPDLNPGDRVAEAKMAEVNAAFDAIKNGNTADSTSTGSRRSADTGSDYYTAVVNFINHGQYAQALTCWAIWTRAIPAGTIWPLWPIWATAIRKRLWQTFALP